MPTTSCPYCGHPAIPFELHEGNLPTECPACRGVFSPLDGPTSAPIPVAPSNYAHCFETDSDDDPDSEPSEWLGSGQPDGRRINWLYVYTMLFIGLVFTLTGLAIAVIISFPRAP